MTPEAKALALLRRIVADDAIDSGVYYLNDEAKAIIAEADRASRLSEARDIYARYMVTDPRRLEQGAYDHNAGMHAILEALER